MTRRHCQTIDFDDCRSDSLHGHCISCDKSCELGTAVVAAVALLDHNKNSAGQEKAAAVTPFAGTVCLNSLAQVCAQCASALCRSPSRTAYSSTLDPPLTSRDRHQEKEEKRLLLFVRRTADRATSGSLTQCLRMTCKPVLTRRKWLSSLTLMTADLLMPAMHQLLDAETAHRLAIRFAKRGLVPRCPSLPAADSILLFKNPVGLAAGFDKNGDGLKGLLKMGFGSVEVGSVTPAPQDGNPRPRVFRLLRLRAIINRDGHEAVEENLKLVATRDEREVRIGLNLGKNKSSPESSVDDYVRGLQKFAQNEVIDYFVINISSPNTPGLRNLQKESQLAELLEAVVALKRRVDIRKPILLKISPDLSPDEREQVCAIIMTTNSRNKGKNDAVIDGIIVSNTTTTRPENSAEEVLCEVGGLSGAPLRPLSTQAIRHVYACTKGTIPIIGVGGVFSGDDAYEKVTAGASLIQIYTSVALNGPPVVPAINRQLAKRLRENGFRQLSHAVGADHRKQ